MAMSVVALQNSPPIAHHLGSTLRSQIFGTEIRSKRRTQNVAKAPQFRVRCLKGMVNLPPEVLQEFVNGKPGSVEPSVIPGADKPLKKSDFPSDFFWGAATSALQTEGRTARGINTWDTFLPDERAVDSYNLYKEDIKCLKEMGANSYRFSIAWSRILPKGSKAGGINQDGIDFYNKLINELLDNGITPFVTLFHFDLPIELQNNYFGFLDEKVVGDFKDYCDICFEAFGDRVKHWSTLNEPNLYGKLGFNNLSSHVYKPTDGFVAMHHLILCHAEAVSLYREKYQAKQGGEIGVVLNLQWYEPYTHRMYDKDARERALDFHFGWFLGPLTCGEYPFVMKAVAGHAVPTFTDEEKDMVKNSFDYIGVNYYTAAYAQGLDPLQENPDQFFTVDDYQYVKLHVKKNGKPIGEISPTELVVYPQGLKATLLYLQREYHIRKLYITENGCSQERNDSIPIETALNDEDRIKYIHDHLAVIHEARNEGVNVRGYFVWSLMDNMEMTRGYTHGFGLHYTDYDNNFQRIPKKSARSFKSFMDGNAWGTLPLDKATPSLQPLRKTLPTAKVPVAQVSA